MVHRTLGKGDGMGGIDQSSESSQMRQWHRSLLLPDKYKPSSFESDSAQHTKARQSRKAMTENETHSRRRDEHEHQDGVDGPKGTGARQLHHLADHLHVLHTGERELKGQTNSHHATNCQEVRAITIAIVLLSNLHKAWERGM